MIFVDVNVKKIHRWNSIKLKKLYILSKSDLFMIKLFISYNENGDRILAYRILAMIGRFINSTRHYSQI